MPHNGRHGKSAEGAVTRGAFATVLGLLAAVVTCTLTTWLTTTTLEESAWIGGLVPLTMTGPDGEWWRLATAPFFHIRIGHLTLNALVLLAAALTAARHLGAAATVFIWLAGGVLASVASLRFTGTWSLGASGANTALVGALLVSLPRLWAGLSLAQRRLLLLGTLPWLVGLTTIGDIGPTDHAAHLGGLATGALLGLLRPWLPVRLGAIALTLATAICFVFAGLHATAPPPATWPPPGWVEVAGPAPCTTSYTNGLAFTCAARPEPGEPPPARFGRYDFLGPRGEPRVLYAPDSPRTRRLLAALAAAPEADYTPAP